MEFSDAAMKAFESEYSYVIMEDVNVIAYLIAFEVSDSTIEVGYIGKIDNYIVNLNAEFYLIIERLFERYHTVLFEIDDVNTLGMDVLKHFNHLPRETWDVYLKE